MIFVKTLAYCCLHSRNRHCQGMLQNFGRSTTNPCCQNQYLSDQVFLLESLYVIRCTRYEWPNKEFFHMPRWWYKPIENRDRLAYLCQSAEVVHRRLSPGCTQDIREMQCQQVPSMTSSVCKAIFLCNLGRCTHLQAKNRSKLHVRHCNINRRTWFIVFRDLGMKCFRILQM